MTILILADHDSGTLSDTVARLVTAATHIGGDIDLLFLGHGAPSAAQAGSKLQGVTRVLFNADSSADELAEPITELLVGLAPAYDVLMAAANSRGKNIMPRLAALLDVMQISEIIGVRAHDTFDRPIYAGNAIQTVQSIDTKKVITVRASSFEPMPADSTAPIIEIAAAPASTASRFVSMATGSSDEVDLSSASIVVSGGRALGGREQFDAIIVPLAEKLGAAIGASRAAVDAGYVLSDKQVGQTGKIVAPSLYIACGISGAIQHVAGMKDSKVIVAINKDADAPIFQIADYGLVADIFDALPELTRKL